MPIVQKSPVAYSAGVETYAEDEDKVAAEINDTMRKIREKTYADTGHALRSVHAKSHALLVGELHVLPGLSAALAQGLFAGAGSYPVVMRISTIPGDVLDDNVSTPRAMAVKIIGVPGERLPGSEGAATQDLVMVNGPAFNAPTTKKFLSSLKLLAPTTDKIEGVKKGLSAVLQVTEKLVEAFGSKSPTLLALGGQAETNPLGDTYFTQAALRYGASICKMAVAPSSAALKALTDAKVDLDGKPNGLREAIMGFFAANGGEWEVRVQLCTDLEKMPVEDASVIWPEDESPYVAVARIVVPSQVAWSDAKSKAIDDGLSFSPWHGLAAHRPLGAIMRARKLAYELSASFRAERNGTSINEPGDLSFLAH